MNVFLQLRDLVKTFENARGPQVVVKDVDLDVREGEFISLIGHSGCGKTTVLSMVAGLARKTAGSITLDGAEITGPGPERAMVFQSPSLLPWLTAEQNVMLGIDSAYRTTPRAERRALADHYLDRLGLIAVKAKRPHELSAGMRQRVGIARAFVLQPRLLLLDEPFGSLDSTTRFELQDVLLELWSKTRTTAVLVTHDVDEALYLSDRIAMMTDGPNATIGEILDVPFARPRRRADLLESGEYDPLRARMLAFLEHTATRRLASATTQAAR